MQDAVECLPSAVFHFLLYFESTPDLFMTNPSFESLLIPWFPSRPPPPRPFVTCFSWALASNSVPTLGHPSSVSFQNVGLLSTSYTATLRGLSLSWLFSALHTLFSPVPIRRLFLECICSNVFAFQYVMCCTCGFLHVATKDHKSLYGFSEFLSRKT